jgi:hypothetical protein
MQHRTSHNVYFVLAPIVMSLVTCATAGAQGNCPGANGNDDQPDDSFIQACLDAGGTIVLDADVSTGYRIDSGLVLKVSGTTLTSTSNYGTKALLIATPALSMPILSVETSSVSNYVLSNLFFYGNKFDRDGAYLCAEGNRWRATSVELRGSGFLVDNVESSGAPCASSMSVETSNFEIRNSWFANNGFPQEERPSWNGPWADGLTVLNCGGGYVHDNHFVDNTDVDLVVGGGNCRVEWNTIDHYNEFGFAGIHVGWFNGFNGNHSGSTFNHNTVTCHTVNKLAGGIVVGMDPWDPSRPWVQNPSVTSNTSTGAVVNLLVDGVNGGEVTGMTLSGAAGNRGHNNCPYADNHTAAHFTESLTMQDGWVFRIYDNGAPCIQ